MVRVTLDLVPVPSYQVKCEDNHNELPTASAVYHRRLSLDLGVEGVMALLRKSTNAFNKISPQSSLHTFHQQNICSAIQASPLYVFFVIFLSSDLSQHRLIIVNEEDLKFCDSLTESTSLITRVTVLLQQVTLELLFVLSCCAALVDNTNFAAQLLSQLFISNSAYLS